MKFESRVERNTDLILGILAEHRVTATFFVLGWIAERYPQLVRDIMAGGHELASHGYGHERASDLTPEAFLQDIRRAKGILEDLCGVEVKGYRGEDAKDKSGRNKGNIDQRNMLEVNGVKKIESKVTRNDI